MIRYFDSSALLKRYVEEPESAQVQRLLGELKPATSRLTEVEIAAALVRRWREGGLPMAERERSLAALRADLNGIEIVELLPVVVGLAIGLLRRHKLRSGDAVQLASCLYLQEKLGNLVELVVFDRRLAEAALAEGLAVAGAV